MPKTQKTADALKKLDQMHKKATSVIVTRSTVFPFDLFPNTLIIDHNKLDIIYRSFFHTSETLTVPINRLNHVSVHTTSFLSSLRIEVKGLDKNPKPLLFLKTADAHLIKNILIGLMATTAENIDLSNLDSGEVIQKLEDIGRAA